VAGPPPPAGGAPAPAPPQDSNTTIAFSSDRDGGPGSFEIYTMAYPGGTPVVKLTDQTAVRHAGAWSPDGRRIAFTSTRQAQGDTDIFTMNADGTGIRNLTGAGTGNEQWPTWSPDGRRIAFMSDRESPQSQATAIFTMNADTGGDVIRITPADGSWHPAWSPALSGGGSKIAFSVYGHAIWTVNPDGTGRQNISIRTDYLYGNPAWSRDGRIAFARGINAYDCAIGYMLPVPGSEQVMLMEPVRANRNPSWSPSGRQIAFSSDRSGNYEIYTVDVTDGTLLRLTTNSVNDWGPLWKPAG
jgi:TolB protein